MRRILIAGLTVLNVALAAAAFVPVRTQPAPNGFWHDCCRGDGPEAYCCRDCCFLGAGCDYSCRPN